MQRWNDLLHPARVLRTCLTLHQPFPDRLLDALWFTLQELGETSFLDLSFLRLSVPQVINILKRFINVEALSLSHNPDITAIHLPFIVASTPTLRRLHVMHINDKSGLDIPSLLALHPPRLRQLEGILNPQFLSCSHTTKWTASFVFRYFSRASIDDSHYVSIPMFTPKQVVLALTDILSLAFQENRYGESTRLWTSSGPLMRRAGPNAYVYSADGFPFYMAARMFLHASLSCGTLRPGQPWSERPIVSVPSDSIWRLSPLRSGGSWVFHFDWDHRRHRQPNPGRNLWGFVFYEASQNGAVMGGGAEVDKEAAPNGGSGSSARRSAAKGPDPSTSAAPAGKEGDPVDVVSTVYDLRGFLRCMADEGRPLPDPEAVERLERILDTRDPLTLEPVCTLMAQDDVLRLKAIITSPAKTEAVYTKRYGGLTTDRWATMYEGRLTAGIPGVEVGGLMSIN